MKLKTHKSTAKKIKITEGKRKRKLFTKHSGQDHFNARESGNITRHKRKNTAVAKVNERTIRRLLPYS